MIEASLRNIFCLLILMAAVACVPAVQYPEPVKPPPKPAAEAERPSEAAEAEPPQERVIVSPREDVKARAGKNAEKEYPAAQEKAKETTRSPFKVTPRGIDFGSIGPGTARESQFKLEFSGTDFVDWTLEGLFDWEMSRDERLEGMVDRRGATVNVRLMCAKGNADPSGDDGKNYTVQLSFEHERKSLSYRKTLSPGYYGEKILFVTRTGEEAVSIMFRVVPKTTGPMFAIDPPAVDLGVVEAGQSLTRRIKVTNKGTGTLRWNAGVIPAVRGRGSAPALRGATMSLLNEEVRRKGTYLPPAHLRDQLEMTGAWLEDNGYPLAEGSSEALLRYKFAGTAIDVIYREGPAMGDIRVSVDDRGITGWSASSPETGRREVRAAEGLADAPHNLTLQTFGGPVVIEGLRIHSRNIKAGPAGWVKVSPDVGTTTREIDYVTIRVQTAGMAPGVYSESVVFRSEDDKATVDVTLTLLQESTAKVIPIYRYLKGSDQLLTGYPGAEDASLMKGYRQEGLAFRLFTQGAPGTTEFYRWFNADKRSHYYAPEQDKKPVPAGYARERPIGNIATVRLSGSRELYRWYNAKTGFYYYTTDSSGEGITKKGYRFDGIAGYVK
jgi:hypothetical protein